MKRLFVLISFSFLVVFLSSCYVTKTVYTGHWYAAWIGKTSQELMLAKGAPTKITDIENGSHIYTWDYSQHYTNTYSGPGYMYNRPTGVASPYDGNVYQPTQTYYQPGNSTSVQTVQEVKIDMFINAEGKIYAWHTTGVPYSMPQRFKKTDLRICKIDQRIFSPVPNSDLYHLL